MPADAHRGLVFFNKFPNSQTARMAAAGQLIAGGMQRRGMADQDQMIMRGRGLERFSEPGGQFIFAGFAGRAERRWIGAAEPHQDNAGRYAQGVFMDVPAFRYKPSGNLAHIHIADLGQNAGVQLGQGIHYLGGLCDAAPKGHIAADNDALSASYCLAQAGGAPQRGEIVMQVAEGDPSICGHGLFPLYGMARPTKRSGASIYQPAGICKLPVLALGLPGPSAWPEAYRIGRPTRSPGTSAGSWKCLYITPSGGIPWIRSTWSKRKKRSELP